MVEAINSWIAGGCNYAAGIGLYELYGDDPFLKRIFKRGENLANKQKLNKLLTELRDKAQAAAVPQPNALPVSKPVPAAPVPVPAPEALPLVPELLQVTRQRDKTHAEMRGLHPYLDVYLEGEDLRELAERIVRLGKQNAVLWERYNILTEGGEDQSPAAPPPPLPVMVDYNLLQQCEAVRKSLNKAEQRLKKQVKPKPKTLELIEERRQELATLRAKITAIWKGGAQ